MDFSRSQNHRRSGCKWKPFNRMDFQKHEAPELFSNQQLSYLCLKSSAHGEFTTSQGSPSLLEHAHRQHWSATANQLSLMV